MSTMRFIEKARAKEQNKSLKDLVLKYVQVCNIPNQRKYTNYAKISCYSKFRVQIWCQQKSCKCGNKSAFWYFFNNFLFL